MSISFRIRSVLAAMGCAAGVCAASADARPLYDDTHALSTDGSVLLVDSKAMGPAGGPYPQVGFEVIDTGVGAALSPHNADQIARGSQPSVFLNEATVHDLLQDMDRPMKSGIVAESSGSAAAEVYGIALGDVEVVDRETGALLAVAGSMSSDDQDHGREWMQPVFAVALLVATLGVLLGMYAWTERKHAAIRHGRRRRHRSARRSRRPLTHELQPN